MKFPTTLKMLCSELVPVADPPAGPYSPARLCAYARWYTGVKAMRNKQSVLTASPFWEGRKT